MGKISELVNTCYIKNIKGKQLLFMPDGAKVPKVVWTKVYDRCKEKDLSYVIVKILINIK